MKDESLELSGNGCFIFPPSSIILPRMAA
jgi:hypothetical protein